MNRISCVIIMIVTLVLSSCAQPTAEPQVEKEAAESEIQVVTPKKGWSEEPSEEIATQLLRSSPTFSSRGIGDSLKLLATTPLDEPFSWQFDYEFNSWAPGYGRLTGEPTPQVITPHVARIVVQEGEIIYAVLDEEWDILADLLADRPSSEGNLADRPSPEGNLVFVGFSQGVQSWPSGDTYSNSELTGRRTWRISSILNKDDETGAPIKDLKVTLNSELTFNVGSGIEGSLVKKGPPVYEWSFGDLVEESQHQGWWVDAVAYFRNYQTNIKPGFDASRSFDKTFFSTSDTQILTIIVTPREEWLEEIGIEVIADGDFLVNPVITSYSPSGVKGTKLTADGHRLAFGPIPVQLNTPLTITVTLQVTPRVPWTIYKPLVGFIPEKQHTEGDAGSTNGGSFSYTMPEAGTWTVSAEGDYVWQWWGSSWIRGSIMFASSTVPLLLQAGVALIIGLTTYFFIRKRRRRQRVSA